MKVFIEPIGRLINEFSKLPGVGAKTAQRFAYKIVNMDENEAKSFADAIINVRYASSAVMQGAAEVIVYGTAVKFI